MSYYKINNNSKYFSDNSKMFSDNISWTPRKITDLIFWGKPEKRYIIKENDIIFTWKDNSGKLNDAVQTNVFNNPHCVDNFINGYPSLYFQNDKFLKIPLTINYFTIFTVIKSNSNNIVYEFGDDTNNETGFYLNGDNNSIGVSNSGLSNLASIKDNGDDWLLDNQWKIITHQYNGTHISHRLFINSIYQSLTNYIIYNNNPGEITSKKILNLGAKSDGTNGTNSYIAEFIVYNKYLTIEEISKVNNYLSIKYNI